MLRCSVTIILLLSLPSLAACMKQKDPPAITAAWTDDFERATPGGDYHGTADAYRISGGVLNVSGAFNHPLWLRKKIPRDAVIELDCWSNTDDADIKVEAWGNGEGHAKDKGQYTTTGYVFVMGGWSNDRSILAKGNEHGKDVVTRKTPKVERGRHYHWKIVRKGAQIDWFVDDMTTPFLSFTDTAPLEGAGHEYFAFNNWQSDLWFDNLTITPL